MTLVSYSVYGRFIFFADGVIGSIWVWLSALGRNMVVGVLCFRHLVLIACEGQVQIWMHSDFGCFLEMLGRQLFLRSWVKNFVWIGISHGFCSSSKHAMFFFFNYHLYSFSSLKKFNIFKPSHWEFPWSSLFSWKIKITRNYVLWNHKIDVIR